MMVQTSFSAALSGQCSAHEIKKNAVNYFFLK